MNANLIFADPGRAAVGLVLALAFILTSCGRDAPPSGGQDAQPPGGEEPAGEETGPDLLDALAPADEEGGGAPLALAQGYADPASFAPAGELEYLQASSMVEQSSATGDGYYHFVPNEQNADVLYYIDYATGQDVPLCAAPNCTHDSEACTAWFPTCVNRKRLIQVGDQIVILYSGNVYYEDAGEDGLPGIDVMNADGSNRQKAFRFAASDMLFREIAEGAARDGENVYFVVNRSTEEKTIRTLCAFHVPTGSTYALYDLPGGNGRIVGVDGGALIFEYLPKEWSIFDNDTGNLQTSRFDLAARQNTVLFERAFNKNAAGSACEDGLRYIVCEDGALRAYDLQTGTLTRETPLAFDEGFQVQYSGFCGYWDGRILLYYLQGNGDHVLPTLYYCAVDVRTGETLRLTQEYTIPESEGVLPCVIAAQWQDNYLLVTGTQYAERTPVEGGPAYYASINQYALMGKEDFWQGCQNWQDIQGGPEA